MKITFWILILFLVKITFAGEFVRYYGTNSTEAKLKFSGKAEIAYSGEDIDVDDLNLQTNPEHEAVKTEVYAQVQHLMSSFMTPQFVDRVGGSAVLGEDYKIFFTAIRKLNASRALVEYIYDSKIVIDKRLFQKNKLMTLPIVLPLAYDKIYEQSIEKGAEKNLCTDLDHNAPEDFFYFWNPDQENCLLKDDQSKVLRLEGTAEILPNTKLTYPEYHKLYLKNELNISIFLGYIDDIKNYKKANTKDDAYVGMKRIEKNLTKLGYKKAEEKNNYQIFEDGSYGAGIAFSRLYLKKVKNKLGKEQTVRIKLYLSDTDAGSPDYTYWTEFIPEMVSTDIFIYDGHSGLGANLELSNFPDLKFNKNLYQIFVFNGCSSYPYYNQTYFQQKGGSKNLDLITSGLPTYTDTMAPNVMGFLFPFIRGEIESYQTFLDRAENTNGDNGTYLVGVNGDEDNTFKPISK
jgi:hypothetical protein